MSDGDMLRGLMGICTSVAYWRCKGLSGRRLSVVEDQDIL